MRSIIRSLGRRYTLLLIPDGAYECHETPHKGDHRRFDRGLARWSGTSFSAPIVAGLIAAEIAASGSDAATARDVVLASSERLSDPTVGPLQALRQPYC